MFLNIHRSGVLTALAWLVPQESADRESQSQRILCTPYNHAPCHFMQSHIRKVYACLAVTCHLHFWQNDRGLLHATEVTWGWNGYQNKSQHRKLTLEKKILLPLQQGFEPVTFRSRVRCSNHWAIQTPKAPRFHLVACLFNSVCCFWVFFVLLLFCSCDFFDKVPNRMAFFPLLFFPIFILVICFWLFRYGVPVLGCQCSHLDPLCNSAVLELWYFIFALAEQYYSEKDKTFSILLVLVFIRPTTTSSWWFSGHRN